MNPSCTDNDVHKGLQWVIYNATLCNTRVWNGGPSEFYSDLRLKYQIGAMNRVMHVVQGL